jgi:hypothetical protein
MKKRILFSLVLLTIMTYSGLSQNPFTKIKQDAQQQGIFDQDILTRDQVFIDDLIVVGSACIGQDCNNGESFGFDTFRMKENNLRMHFQDTSTSASFPTNDWRFIFNDSSNGGSNYFAVEDSNTARQIFRVDAGAPANSLRVDSQGDVGIGNSSPVVELHMTDGDTPTMRMEQNGSSGFTPQTWDLAGNETNFFIRDVTNGSKLPFRIRPGAPSSSIDIAASGSVGIEGVPNTNASLDLQSNNKGLILNRLDNTQRTTLGGLLGAEEGVVVFDTDDKSTYVYNGTEWSPIGGAGSGLEALTEGGNTGWRLIGSDPANYGDIGLNALDLSYSNVASTTFGATGENSVAMGQRTKAIGMVSTAMGMKTIAKGSYSTSMGQNSNAKGRVSTVMGKNTIANDFASLVIGVFNTTQTTSANSFNPSNRALVIGNGTSGGARSDALTVLFDGTTTIAGDVTATTYYGDGSNLTGIGFPEFKLQDASINGTLLKIETENGSFAEVDLSPMLQDLLDENAAQQ